MVKRKIKNTNNLLYLNKCEVCLKDDESVKPNFIMHSFKLCDSCKLAKTIFPV